MAHSAKQLQVISSFGHYAMCNTPEEIQAYKEGKAKLNKYVLHSGVVGCGKTYSIAEAFGLYCADLQARGITKWRFIVAGQSINSVRKNFGNQLTELFGASGYVETQSTKDGIVKDAVLFGQYLFWVGLSDAKSEERIRGLTNIIGIICDEVTLFDEKQFGLLEGRLRSTISEHDKLLIPDDLLINFMIGSTNPAGPTHWLVKRISDGRMKLVKWCMNDACWDGAEDYYYERKRAWYDTPVLYKRNLLGLWVSNDGAVYPGFSIKRHTYRDSDYYLSLSEMDRNFIGVDAGQNHPTAVVLCSVSGSTRIVSKSLRLANKAPSDIARSIAEMYDMLTLAGKGNAVYLDPAAAWLKEELRKLGIISINALNDHMLGINYIRGLLGTDELLINFDTCEDVVKEISNYSFKSEDSEEINKINDDFADATRYGLYTDFKYNGGVDL